MSVIVHTAVDDNAGLGHLKRCLSIAEELRKLSYQVDFLIGTSRFSKLVHSFGFPIKKRIRANQKYDIFIIDKYDTDESFLSSCKKYCRTLVRIDDAAPTTNKDRISDVIVNGNPYADAKHYNGFVRGNCHLIVGRDFIPMDTKFCRTRKIYHIRENISNIVVAFGASNKGKAYSYDVSKKVMALDLSASLHVLDGEKLREKFDHLYPKRLKLLPLVENVHHIFSKSDIAICSSSTTCWQLAAIGVPFIAFKTADNQLLAFNYIMRTRLGIALDRDAISNGKLEKEIRNLNKRKRELLSKKSRDNIDCRGSQRIAHKLNELAL